MNEIVQLDVGGRLFKTSLSTLICNSDSYFGRMFSGDWRHSRQSDGSFFIDRDNRVFGFILDFLRCGSDVILPQEATLLALLRREAEYYALTPLLALIDDREIKHENRMIQLEIIIEKGVLKTEISWARVCSSGNRLACLISDQERIAKMSQIVLDLRSAPIIKQADIDILRGLRALLAYLKWGSAEVHRFSTLHGLYQWAKYFQVPEAVAYAKELKGRSYPSRWLVDTDDTEMIMHNNNDEENDEDIVIF